MLGSERGSYLVPFPKIADSKRTKYPVKDLSIRPFGISGNDLDIDFNQKLHPVLVTQILHCCTTDTNGEAPDQAFFWELTVGKRIECLLAIATAGGTSDLFIYLRCLNQSCRQEMEVEVSIDELVALQHRTDDIDHFMVKIGDTSFPIRRPTGCDQLEWLKSSFTDEDAAIKAMIRTLALDEGSILLDQEGQLPDEWVQTINIAMGEFDPLVNFNLSVHCPYCEKESQYEIDLEDILLSRLHRAQQHLFGDVHRLAVHYHWSELQIFSVPSWRRSHYLSLIEKEEDK
jgi:hypothetical protein